jgi:hypothetical protein
MKTKFILDLDWYFERHPDAEIETVYEEYKESGWLLNEVDDIYKIYDKKYKLHVKDSISFDVGSFTVIFKSVWIDDNIIIYVIKQE